MNLGDPTTSFSTSPITFSWPSSEDVQVQRDNQPFTLFEHPFDIEDLLVFDDPTLKRLLESERGRFVITDLACALRGAPEKVVERIRSNLEPELFANLDRMMDRDVFAEDSKRARKRVVRRFFWDLVYWKMPELYDELTEGESLHPGIFQHLEPEIRGRIVLDAAAGTGRATFECLRCKPGFVYAVDPSPGLLGVLEKKLTASSMTHCTMTRLGSFDHLPLGNQSVDIALACSAFTSAPEQGGEVGLTEFRRVIRPGGKLVIIWPGPDDYTWLASHGFQYVGFQENEKATVRFRSLQSALRCARLFYAGNKALMKYLLEQQQPEVSFSLLGLPQPHAYCWLAL